MDKNTALAVAQVACAEPDANPIHCQESLMTESTVTRYADLLNVLCDMQVSPVYAARKQVLSDAENAIVFLEKEVSRLTEENKRLSGKQEYHPAFAFTGFIPDEDTRRNDAAFEESRKMVRVTPAMIAALDRNLVGQVAQSREQLLGHALQSALAYLPTPVPTDAVAVIIPPGFQIWHRTADPSMTDEANEETRWVVERLAHPFTGASGTTRWFGATLGEAVHKALTDLPDLTTTTRFRMSTNATGPC